MVYPHVPKFPNELTFDFKGSLKHRQAFSDEGPDSGCIWLPGPSGLCCSCSAVPLQCRGLLGHPVEGWARSSGTTSLTETSAGCIWPLVRGLPTPVLPVTHTLRDVFILAQWLSWAKEKFGEGEVIWISVCARRVSKIISPAVFTWKSKSVKGAWIINLYPVSALQVSGNWCSIYLRLHWCVCIRCIHGADLAP